MGILGWSWYSFICWPWYWTSYIPSLLGELTNVYTFIFGEQQIFILDCVGDKKITLQNNVYIPNYFDYNWSIKTLLNAHLNTVFTVWGTQCNK